MEASAPGDGFVRVCVRPATLGNRHLAPIPLEFNGLASAELDQRVAAFEDTIKAPGDQINRWTWRRPGLVPDMVTTVTFGRCRGCQAALPSRSWPPGLQA